MTFYCDRSATRRREFLLPTFSLLISLAIFTPAVAADQATMVIAPLVDGLTYCPEARHAPSIKTGEDIADFCFSHGFNAALPLSRALDSIGPRRSPSGRYELGYVLDLSVMIFYSKTARGWMLDRKKIAAAIRMVHDVDRPVVVYLSANHFTESAAALSQELGNDPRNLMWTKDGPLPPDKFFGIPVYPWTLTDDDAPINVMRRKAFGAILNEICRLDANSRRRIVAVSVLGEVHHFYPHFMDGMLFEDGFDVTDYSPAAISLFRKWLREKYVDIARLNSEAGTHFASFEAVVPPSKNINSDGTANLSDHIDAYAAGVLPVYGWLWARDGSPTKVAIYLDGAHVDTVDVDLNRTDVSDIKPEVRTPNVGFRYNMNFTHILPGIHTLDVLALMPGHKPVLMTHRRLLVRGGAQRAALPLIPSKPVDANPQGAEMEGYVDGPADGLAIVYNPFAKIWLDFRNDVVRRYIERFAGVVEDSCIPHDRIFSHQITPQLVPTWNSDLMAVDASQRPDAHYLPGTTLYGGSAFGKAFFDMKEALGWTTYGVSELHPIFAMSEDGFKAMFEAHRRHGARFVSPYFITLTPRNEKEARGELDRRVIAPNNPAYASDAYYRAISDIMKND